MEIAAKIMVGIVGLIHVGFFIAEAIFWKYELVHKRLDYNEADAERVYPIVINAGFYNAYIAAGLLWTLFEPANAFEIKLFFLACVFVAGIVGAATLTWKTIVLQSLPAVITIYLVWVTRPTS